MDTLAPVPSVQIKKIISFWSVLVMYIYHLISVAVIFFVPYMIVIGVGMIFKYQNQGEILLQTMLNNPILIGLKLVLSLVSSIIVIIVVFQDLEKNYQIDQSNYKKALNVLFIIYILSFLASLKSFDVSSLILYVFLSVFLFWLGDKKFVKGEKIFEEKFLTFKNVILLILGVMILSSIAIYLI